jgi:hypothetical protein
MMTFITIVIIRIAIIIMIMIMIHLAFRFVCVCECVCVCVYHVCVCVCVCVCIMCVCVCGRNRGAKEVFLSHVFVCAVNRFFVDGIVEKQTKSRRRRVLRGWHILQLVFLADKRVFVDGIS